MTVEINTFVLNRLSILLTDPSLMDRALARKTRSPEDSAYINDSFASWGIKFQDGTTQAEKDLVYYMWMSRTEATSPVWPREKPREAFFAKVKEASVRPTPRTREISVREEPVRAEPVRVEPARDLFSDLFAQENKAKEKAKTARMALAKAELEETKREKPLPFVRQTETTTHSRKRVTSVFAQTPNPGPRDPTVLHKTSLCNSVLKGYACKRGDECTYAHSYEALIPRNCRFGADCTYICRTAEKGVFVGKCKFWHPTETPQGYVKRTQTDRPKREEVDARGIDVDIQSPRRTRLTAN